MRCDRRQLDELLSAVCDGTASAVQQRRLADLLAHDDRAVDTYLQWVDTHVLLGTTPALVRAAAEPADAAVAPRFRAHRQRKYAISAVSAAALVLLFGVATAAWVTRRPPPPQTISVSRPGSASRPETRSAIGRVPSVAAVPRPSAVVLTEDSRTDDEQWSAEATWPTAICSLPARDITSGVSASFGARATSILPRDASSVTLPAYPLGGPAVSIGSPELLAQRTMTLPGAAVAADNGPPAWRRDKQSRMTMSIPSLTSQWRNNDEL